MASQFLRLTHRPLLMSIPVCLSLSVAHSLSRPAIRCDYAPGIQPALSGPYQPSVSHSHTRGGLSQSTVRQISLGSVLGLLVGLGLRIFSKALTLAFGLGIVLIEWAASRGYHIIPTGWLQRRVKSVDIRRLASENIPFKTTFGATLALAAFAQI